MKKIMFSILAIGFFMLQINPLIAQIKNEKTVQVKIYGNCAMCKKTIEKAGNVKKTAKIDWNEESKIAEIKFDSVSTNLNDILKRVADSGYDSDLFTAPTETYNNLHSCCKYERPKKEKPKVEKKKMN